MHLRRLSVCGTYGHVTIGWTPARAGCCTGERQHLTLEDKDAAAITDPAELVLHKLRAIAVGRHDSPYFEREWSTFGRHRRSDWLGFRIRPNGRAIVPAQMCSRPAG
jgi:hypothetical protein